MIERILNSADRAVDRFVFQIWDQFQLDYGPVLLVLAAIAIVIAGQLLWMGRLQLTFGDLGSRFIKIAIPFVLITQLGSSERFLYTLATDVPNQIAGTMASALGQTDGDINQSFDQIVERAMGAAGNIASRAGFADIGTVLLGWAIILVALVALVPISVVLLLSKVAVGILLALAPFAIALYFFDSTRSLFEGWLRQLLGFALTPVVIYALLGLVLSLVTHFSDPVLSLAEAPAAREYSLAEASGFTPPFYVAEPGPAVPASGGSASGPQAPLPSIGSMGPFMLVMIAVGYLSLQAMAWASGIAGSIALSANRALSMPSSTMRFLQGGSRGSAHRPDAQERSGKAASARTAVAQAALTSRAFVSGAARQALGMRPSRYADPSHRPRPSSAAKFRPPKPEGNDGGNHK